MDLVERWWNSQFGVLGRCDVWLNSDGETWHVRARQGGSGGDEVRYACTQEWEARAMIDRLVKARPSGHWKGHHRPRYQAEPVPSEQRPG